MEENDRISQFCKNCVNYEECPQKILKNAIYRPGPECGGFYPITYERCHRCVHSWECISQNIILPDHKECADFLINFEEGD